MITPLCHRGMRSKTARRDGPSFLEPIRTSVRSSVSLTSSSNLEAAQLLMHVRRLALQEANTATTSTPSTASSWVPSSPVIPSRTEAPDVREDQVRKTKNKKKQSSDSYSRIPMPTPPSLQLKTLEQQQPRTTAPRGRSRVVSVDDSSGTMMAISSSNNNSTTFSPAVACVTPTTPDRQTYDSTLKPIDPSVLLDTTAVLSSPPHSDRSQMSLPLLLQQHLMNSTTTTSTTTNNNANATTAPTAILSSQYKSNNKQFVGQTLPPGVALKNVLRKKFSWKTFPELEAFLVEHRDRYLNCSSSLNYTKTQKVYNNHLTQGLLDLAGQEGYIFEGFTFPAIRDRIRCFYKSYVQATKKKKRSSSHRSSSNGSTKSKRARV